MVIAQVRSRVMQSSIQQILLGRRKKKKEVEVQLIDVAFITS